ncbi:MAG TPA: hypothetical protein VMS95_00720 [Candidatus Krumholzibacteriaceae bacterium]|nr:hypothetical protein [Candidatus Krumholzibacteriaceae bacterium]
MRRGKRGQVRVMEAFLSALLIFSALAISAALSPPATGGINKTLVAQGMQALVQLDSDGRLGEMIDARNWTALSGVLQLVLPVGAAYNLTVYDENMQQVTSSPVSNGELVGNVVSIEYLCAVQGLQFRVYSLRLQLAVVR